MKQSNNTKIFRNSQMDKKRVNKLISLIIIDTNSNYKTDNNLNAQHAFISSQTLEKLLYIRTL